MNRLNWCTQIRNGIVLVDPSDNLASAYFKKAESSLEAMHTVGPPEWKITAGYYALYFSLYAVLMKLGIRSENHTCTLALMQQLLPAYFTPDETKTIDRARRARIDTQYYTSATISDDQLDELTRAVPRFLVRCRTIVNRLTEADISAIRERYAILTRET